jgi:ribonuclease HI
VPAIYTCTHQTLFITRHTSIPPKNIQNIPKLTQKSQTHKTFDGQLTPAVIVVTDTSVHQERAASAWIIATDKGKIIVCHSAQIREENISSYRAESHGILNAVQMLQQHALEVQQWTLYRDNQALIQRLQSTKDTKEIPPDWTDSDMIESIIKTLILNGEFKHVKGLQIQQESSPH